MSGIPLNFIYLRLRINFTRPYPQYPPPFCPLICLIWHHGHQSWYRANRRFAACIPARLIKVQVYATEHGNGAIYQADDICKANFVGWFGKLVATVPAPETCKETFLFQFVHKVFSATVAMDVKIE